MKFSSILIFCFLIGKGQIMFCQQYLGIVGSNYAGTNNLYANPSNAVDSRYKIYVNLAAADLFLGNNAIRWDAPYSFIKLLKGAVNKNDRVIWRNRYLIPIENNRDKNMNGLIDVRGPAVMYAIDSKQSIAISSRGRGGASFSNVSHELATLMQYGTRNPTIFQSASDLHMNLNMNSFAEIGATYAKDISLNPEEAIKVGITAKRIIGLSNFHMNAKESSYQITDNVINPDDPGFLYDDVLFLNHINAQYGYSDEDNGINDFSMSPGYWLGTASPGRGIGFDIGVSYEYRPEIHKYTYKEKGIQKIDQTQNKYKYKIGVSLIDVGRVKFDNPSYVSNFESVADNRYVFENGIKLFPNRRLMTGINRSLGPYAGADLQKFKANLPTTFQAYFDYKVKENIYVYSTWVQNLRSSNSLGMRMPSLVSVVPRYETKWIDVAMPVSLLNDYQLLTIGLAARFGPVFIGSDNLQGLLNIANPRGFDFFVGANIPIFNKLPSSPTKCYYDQPQPAWKNIFKKKGRKLFKGNGQI